MSGHFDKISSRAAFRRLLQKRESVEEDSNSVLSDQPRPSGSKWSTEALRQYQVVCEGEFDVLPLLEEFYDRSLNTPRELQPLGKQLEGDRALGPFPSETDVFHALGGHSMSVFWGALLRFDHTATSSHGHDRPGTSKGEQSGLPSRVPATPLHPQGHKRNASAVTSSSSSSASPSAVLPQQNNSPSLPIVPLTPRRRKKIANPDYVDSTDLQIGSSSQNAPPSTPGSQSSEYVDQSAHALAAHGASEDQTVHLLQSFIQCALHLLQPGGSKELVEVDIVKYAHQRTTSSGLRFSAVDDGGLRLRRRLGDQGWVTTAERVAIIEAKRQFTFDDERHVISDDRLGQMLAESLTARLIMASDANHIFSDQEHVIIVGAAQQYVQFLSFEIPEPYIQSIEAGHRLDPNIDSHYIVVHASKVLNLARVDDRMGTLRHLAALIQWVE